MMKYRTRPGVFLEYICDNPVLLSTTEALRFCPYYTILNDTSAFLWTQLSTPRDFESLVAAVLQEYDNDKRAELEKDIKAYLEEMVQLNYLVWFEQEEV